MQQKKVLLVNPSQRVVYEKLGGLALPHMGLAYLGAVLEKAGCCVKLVDVDYENLSAEEVGEMVKDENIELVCLTATTPVINNALAAARAVKAFRPETKVIIGGFHATIMSQTVILEPAIDVVVRGEGETTLSELLEAVSGRKDLKEILGITYKEDGRAIENLSRPPIENLDEIPWPARHLFRPAQYRFPNSLYYPAAAIHTSRGCPGDCTFCQAKNMYGHRVRFRSVAAVVDEMEFLVKKCGIRQIDVWDDNFASSKTRVFQVRDEILRRKLKIHLSFKSGIRVDTACDESVLMAMREMGGFNIAFGIESGNQQILDKAQKGITLEQARTAVALAKKIGFEVWAYFMLGFPDDTEVTMRQTIAFAKELEPHIAHFHILKPYPGSKIYEEMKKESLIDNFDFENYGMYAFPVHHTRFVSNKKIFDFQGIAYRSFYLRPKAFMSQLRNLRSWSRVVNNIRSGMGILRIMLSGSRD